MAEEYTRISPDFPVIPRAEYAQALQRAQDLARARVRVDADGSHGLGGWIADLDRPGYERVCCLHCGAGAVLHLDTAAEAMSDALLAPCRGAR